MHINLSPTHWSEQTDACRSRLSVSNAHNTCTQQLFSGSSHSTYWVPLSFSRPSFLPAREAGFLAASPDRATISVAVKIAGMTVEAVTRDKRPSS